MYRQCQSAGNGKVEKKKEVCFTCSNVQILHCLTRFICDNDLSSRSYRILRVIPSPHVKNALRNPFTVRVKILKVGVVRISIVESETFNYRNAALGNVRYYFSILQIAPLSEWP